MLVGSGLGEPTFVIGVTCCPGLQRATPMCLSTVQAADPGENAA